MVEIIVVQVVLTLIGVIFYSNRERFGWGVSVSRPSVESEEEWARRELRETFDPGGITPLTIEDIDGTKLRRIWLERKQAIEAGGSEHA